MLHIVLVSALVSVCNAGCGTFKAPSGNMYYLDPLTKSIDYSVKEQSTTYTYYYNYCQVLTTPSTCTTPSLSTQISATGTCTSIGLPPPNITELESKQGVLIVYKNTIDLCGNPKTIPRITMLNVTCNPSVEYNLVLIEEPGVCQYLFKVQSQYACPNNPPPYNKSDCCVAQSNPGCAEPNIERCVCMTNPECCTSGWNSDCVNLVTSLGCGDCTLGNCCDTHPGKGCEDRAVSTCVCTNVEECCTTSWTSECVSAVNKYKCGDCAGVCCAVDQPCTDQKVLDCVCSKDVYCCDVKWDATCAKEAIQFNCTFCPSYYSTPRGETLLPRLLP